MSNKVFIYTVSDFKAGSIECIEMLFGPLLNERNIDLAIICNYDPYKKINQKIKIIHDDGTDSKSFIGFLKFSEKIPEGYEYYIYLDSDILFFGNIHDLYNPRLDFSIVREHWVPMTHQWHCYKHRTEEEYDKMSKLNGINSGTFAFKNVNFIKNIKKYYQQYITNDVMSNIMLEQSSFNYAICKELDFCLEKTLDLTDKTVLFAQDKNFDKQKTIYHFNGFNNQMSPKYAMMKDFYENKYLNNKQSQ
jgi:hypothetical protein